MKVTVLIPSSRFAKNVARDLIWGSWCKGRRIAGAQFDPVSQLVLTTLLQQHGHDARLLDAASLALPLETVKHATTDDDVVIVLSNTVTIQEDAATLAVLKAANPKLKTIVYGNHPSYFPEDTVKKPGIDFGIQKEAEWAIRDLVNGLDQPGDAWKETPGIAFQDGGAVRVNVPYPYIQNLDDLPIPNRRQLPPGVVYFNPVIKRMPFTTMTTSRGCPSKCNYCSAPPFYGRIYRMQTPMRVVDEMEQIQRLGYREVFFRDEVWTCNKHRTLEICDQLIQRNLNLTWIVSTRVDTVDQESMEAMKAAGCHMLRFGVESGSEEVLKNIEKDATLDRARQAFQWAKDVGLDTHAHCMIGMPGETEATMQHTLDFLLELEPTTMTCTICTPYPGTPLFERVLKAHPEIGDGSQWDLAELHTKTFYNEAYTNVSNDALSWWVRHIYRRFYLRPAYLVRTFGRLQSGEELRRVMRAARYVVGFAFGKD